MIQPKVVLLSSDQMVLLSAQAERAGEGANRQPCLAISVLELLSSFC